MQEGADETGRSAPVVASHVRVAVDPRSLQQLRDEEGNYRNINEGHRKHFEGFGSGALAWRHRRDRGCSRDWRPYHSALDLPIARLLADYDATSLLAAAMAAAL